jgi:hypothetical protein
MKNTILLLFTTTIIFACSSFAQTSTGWLWGIAAGSDNGMSSVFDYGEKICTDSEGNVYATGWFESASVTFGNYTLNNAGNSGSDGYIVKLDQYGNTLWALHAGGSGNDNGLAICIDSNGDILVTGKFTSTDLVFGNTTLSRLGTLHDIFIVKITPSGNVIWAKRYGTTDVDYGNAISADRNGNFYVTGSYSSASPIDFDGEILTSGGVYLTKFNTNGQAIWARGAIASWSSQALSVTTDREENVFITGKFTGSIPFDTYVLSSSGSDDFFIAKYDSSGAVLWASSAGGTGADNGFGIVTDTSGNSIVVGNSGSSSVTFGGLALSNPKIFTAKYDPDGNVIWAKKIGSASAIKSYAQAIDSNNDTYITGTIGGTTTIGSTTLTGAGLFAAKYNSSGGVIWAKKTGSSSNDAGQGIALDSKGNVYITGSFWSGAIVFGNVLQNSYSNYPEIFVARLCQNPPSLPTISLNGGTFVSNSATGNQWFLEGDSIINATSQTYMPLLNGNYTVRVTDSTGCYATSTIYNLTTVTIDNIENNYSIVIYPNPANSTLTIEATGGNKPLLANIYNAQGQLVISSVVEKQKNSIDISSLNPGIYIISIFDGEKQTNKKIIKQ